MSDIYVLQITLDFISEKRREDIIDHLTDDVYKEYLNYCKKKKVGHDTKNRLTAALGRKMEIGTKPKWFVDTTKRIYCDVEHSSSVTKLKNKRIKI